MKTSDAHRATAAAVFTATALQLPVEEVVVLHDSNKLTLRLLPCDAVARVSPAAKQAAQLEVELAQRLAELDCPVAALDPRVEARVYERGEFVVTLWTFYAPVPPGSPSPVEYAGALKRLHAGMRRVGIPTPHFTDRVEEAEALLASSTRTPALADDDREFLRGTLRSLRQVIVEQSRAEQLLHGEPHPNNVLATKNGPMFIDLETCCRGPVEFDLAHAPKEVAVHYPDADEDLLRQCRILALAMITAWRWDRDDHLPNGRHLGQEWLRQLRAALD